MNAIRTFFRFFWKMLLPLVWQRELKNERDAAQPLGAAGGAICVSRPETVACIYSTQGLLCRLEKGNVNSIDQARMYKIQGSK